MSLYVKIQNILYCHDHTHKIQMDLISSIFFTWQWGLSVTRITTFEDSILACSAVPKSIEASPEAVGDFQGPVNDRRVLLQLLLCITVKKLLKQLLLDTNGKVLNFCKQRDLFKGGWRRGTTGVKVVWRSQRTGEANNLCLCYSLLLLGRKKNKDRKHIPGKCVCVKRKKKKFREDNEEKALVLFSWYAKCKLFLYMSVTAALRQVSRLSWVTSVKPVLESDVILTSPTDKPFSFAKTCMFVWVAPLSSRLVVTELFVARQTPSCDSGFWRPITSYFYSWNLVLIPSSLSQPPPPRSLPSAPPPPPSPPPSPSPSLEQQVASTPAHTVWVGVGSRAGHSALTIKVSQVRVGVRVESAIT